VSPRGGRFGDTTYLGSISQGSLQHIVGIAGNGRRYAYGAFRVFSGTAEILEGRTISAGCGSDDDSIDGKPDEQPSNIEIAGMSIDQIMRLKARFENVTGKSLTEFWEDAFNAGVRTAQIDTSMRDAETRATKRTGYRVVDGKLVELKGGEILQAGDVLYVSSEPSATAQVNRDKSAPEHGSPVS